MAPSRQASTQEPQRLHLVKSSTYWVTDFFLAPSSLAPSTVMQSLGQARSQSLHAKHLALPVSGSRTSSICPRNFSGIFRDSCGYWTVTDGLKNWPRVIRMPVTRLLNPVAISFREFFISEAASASRWIGLA